MKSWKERFAEVEEALEMASSHNHLGKSFPMFFGVKEWPDGYAGPFGTDESYIERYKLENSEAVTLRGSNGPWAARNRFGPASATIVLFTGWPGSHEPTDAIGEMATQLGFDVVRVNDEPQTNEIKDMEPYRRYERLFNHPVDIEAEVPSGYLEMEAFDYQTELTE